MKILVVGSAGQLARALAVVCSSRRDVECLCLGRPDLDLASANTVERVISRAVPDVVINAAAYTAVDRAESEPDLAMLVNAKGAGRVAAAARRAGARMIQISTDYVFDGTSERPYCEGDPPNPLNVYGKSKLEGERATVEACNQSVVIRTAWIYSEFGQNFLRTMLHLAESRSEVVVVDDQFGNPTSAMELAKGLFVVLESWRDAPERGLGEIFHLAATGSASWFEFAQRIFEASRAAGGPACTVTRISARDWSSVANRPVNSRLDCNKFRSAFGHGLPDWSKSVEETVVAALASSGSIPAHGSR